MQGLTTQVSDMKSNTTYTTDLKKNLDNCGSAPSLLRILVIFFHTALYWDKFLTEQLDIEGGCHCTATHLEWRNTFEDDITQIYQ